MALGGLSGGKGACNWAGGVVIGIQVCSMHRFFITIHIPGNQFACHSQAICLRPSPSKWPYLYRANQAPSAPSEAPHPPSLSTEVTLHTNTRGWGGLTLYTGGANAWVCAGVPGGHPSCPHPKTLQTSAQSPRLSSHKQKTPC